MRLEILIVSVFVLLQLIETDANCTGGTSNIKLKKEAIAYLSSPNYPFANYLRNQTCTWKYTAKDTDSVLRIEVYRSYFEETDNGSQPCADFVSVYKGTNTFLGLQLGRLCGVSNAKTFESDEGGSLYIEFKSNDDSNVGRGFAAKVVCVDKAFRVEFVLGPLAAAGFISFCLFCHCRKKAQIKRAAADKRKADEEAKKKKKTEEDAKKKAEEEAKKKSAEEEAKKTKDQSTSPLKTAANVPTTVSFIGGSTMPYGGNANVSFLGSATGGANPLPAVASPNYESLYPSTIDTTGNVVVNFNNHPPSAAMYNPQFPEENRTTASYTKPPPYTK